MPPLTLFPPPVVEPLVAGIDEVGRGCLAGPVVAAAVILPAEHGLTGLADSKKLSARQRERLSAQIREVALGCAIGVASVEEIDRINILQATFLAMRRAYDALPLRPTLCRIDGNQRPRLPGHIEMVVGGDGIHAEIMAASIVAKVWRDAHLVELAARFPDYGFAEHKGYGTPLHLASLRQLGPSVEHRMSFAPCAAARVAEAGGR